MARRRNQAESTGKAVEAAAKADGAKTPMERFRAMARRLITVRPEEIAKQQREYEITGVALRRARRKRS
jgi:hypothetical protein